MNGNATRFVRFGAGFLGLVTLGWVLTGQAAKPAEQGVPTDWTHQHVIFSQPATAEQADLVERDPRYWQQWYRRNVTRVLSVDPTVPAADASMELVGDRPAVSGQTHQDWSVNMGTGASVGAGNFAAKYSFSTSVANCASAAQPDFVVFSTGLQSAAGTASIVAYDNLYSGCTGTAPNTYWAYSTSLAGPTPGTIKTSPIISLDGSQIAFVQTDGLGHGYLVLLKWKPNNGTLAAPVAPTIVTAVNYSTCTAPCMVSFSLRIAAGVGAQTNDTTSAVFYDYTGDNLWVGDSLGLLHKFHPVFGAGTPTEAGSPWPVKVNVANPTALSSPVYDHRSGNIFVGDAGGFLEAINATTGASVVSAQLDHGTGIVSGPVLDISAEKVYAFASSDGTTGCAAGAPCAAVYEFSATGGLATSTKVTVGVSSATAPNPLYFGAFDSAYLNSYTATGNIYVCGNTGANPILYRIPINAGTLPAAGTALTNVTTAASTAACSPVTDVANPNLAIGSTENLFLSPQLNGRPNACAAKGCLISFASTPWQPSVNFALGQEILTSKLHIETVVVAGTAGATAPTWTTTAGVTVTDGSVTWMDQGALSAGALGTWKKNNAYALHTRIVDSNGYVEIVTGAGTSGPGPAAPTWPTAAGTTTTDNSVTWTNAGFLPTTALLATGGTSGVIMDNTVGSGGASQVYYSILGSQACGTGGTGGCAVQTSQ